jgi:hypothetical protein
MILDERNSRGDIIRFEKHILTSDGKLLNLADNTNHGTLTDVTATTNQRGETGAAQDYNGTSSVIRIPDFAGANLGAAMSAMATIRPDVVDVASTQIIGQYDGGAGKRSWNLGVNLAKVTGAVSADGGATNIKVYHSGSILTAGVAYRIGMLFTVNSLKLYFQGNEITSLTQVLNGTVNSLYNNDVDITLGASLNNNALSGLFNGMTCDIIVKNVALTPEEFYDDYLEFLG